ncbi:DUF6603 domain-containing protein [Streptomyces lateritius]|uniref:DUF6603 domain-containing protein n=1 Tax=Streptomyces lateritius TaxID=67313 RepID=UPI001995818C|nr:DUF6603 domain-containing protein [Streptomyces lateritius]GGU12229.1 hypothetical protein GCM10010272_66820 [Streptomyces lateritius]
MSGERGTLDGLVGQLVTLLSPLSGLTPAGAREFLAEVGLPLTDAQAASIAPTLSTTTGSVGFLVELLRGLQEAIDAERWDEVLRQVLQAGGQINAVLSGFDGLKTALAGLSLPGSEPILANFPERLFNLLLARFLGGNQGVNELLEFLGVLVRTDRNVGPVDPQKPFFTENAFHLDRIGGWLREPDTQLGALYDWGAPVFDGSKVLTVLDRLAAYAGLPSLYDKTATPPTLDLLFASLTPRTGLDPRGMAVELPQGLTKGTIERTGEHWTLTLRLDADVPADTTLVFQPGKARIEPPQGATVQGTAEVVHSYRREPGDPVPLLSLPGGSRVTAEQLDVVLRLRAQPDGTLETQLGALLQRGKVLIHLDGGDGFVAKLLGGVRIESDFELGAAFTPADGLRFEGSGGLEIQLASHVGLGPVDLSAVTLLLGVQDTAFTLGLTTDVKAGLGPITAAVQGIGTEIPLVLAPGGQGNLGPVDVRPRFKAPKGVGLSMDLDVVSGGGFLYYDPARGEYAGALEFQLARFIDVKAIGLISTRMPDGTQGFSLLIILTAEFGGIGLQLGYGFTLLAVGGLLGLHRGMNLGALAEGVRTGAVESVMFPKDVVANAPRVLSDLRAFFPPKQGTFLVGPMAKIGWGTPTLISVSLGVILEIPGNIAIIGVLRCVLPSRELPLLVLQVNFVGALEFDKQRLWFYAQLFESRILLLTVEGGMGLLVGWGRGDLVLSVGGFHPSFTPPPLPFPAPPRISVDIINQPFARIRVSGYFAVTSNTAQFGARAELVLGFDEFGLHGHLAFDALFRFSPFAFVIDIAAAVSLKAFGVGLFSIHLRFQLEGPAPWRARGRGSISLLFFDVSVDFDLTWGDGHNPTLPPIDVLPLLSDEIGKAEGWQTRLPTGGTNALVNLRTLPGTDRLVLHPLGTLFIHQRLIPLNVRLDRVGAQRPRDGKRFSIEPVPDSGLVRVSVPDDKFAMAQFQDMDDAAKLSRLPYEDQDAGLELAAALGALASARAVRRSARYELIVTDSKGRQAETTRAVNRVRLPDTTTVTTEKRLCRVSPAVFQHLLDGSSTSRSSLSRHEATLRQPYGTDDTLRLTGQRFVVAHKRNNQQAFPPGTGTSPVGGGPASFRSRTTADEALAEWVAQDPGLAGALHVIPESESTGATAVPGGWTDTTAMPAAVGTDSSTDAAVLLSGGRVLLAGGADSAGAAVTDSTLFDPVTGTWTPADRLKTGRRLHTLTRLRDGRVLAYGGLGADGTALSSPELYDPLAARWTAGPASTPPRPVRYGHCATLLETQKVLVTGGTGARGQGVAALPSAELYDPATGQWNGAKPMTDARTGHQAVKLRTGRVLVIGGALLTGRGRAALAQCELYDPATGAWTPTGSLTTARVGHQATLLPDGRVLVTGGDTPAGRPGGTYRAGSLDSAEIYDPTTGAWTLAARMPGGRGRHRAVLLPTGKVLVLGGTGGPRCHAGYRDAATYDPAANAWSATGALAAGRWDFTALALADGRVLAAGGRVLTGAAAPGQGGDVLTAAAEIFTP